ncbi:hypothetical protein AMATHDRAFT_143456 [Amanita thiersii Skay4041]|uniref:Prokaryotic-type class I peptide chain release factors domain-containing protein n=1 Tax=Amanita thiersii Skay4041 TaxID=703135 RepID=A0A2A9NLX0_9AGAR|nr:hypothetical protein AMATHDRAFT_143456 [Amanita thiersii Skay4041]
MIPIQLRWAIARYPLELRLFSTLSDVFPIPPSLKSLDTPVDKAMARQWVAELKKHTIPKHLVEFTFARSSGPGGQNVNKVNTKATLRCQLHSPWIPLWAREELRRCNYYLASKDELLISSTTHRSQAQNIAECIDRLHEVLVSASSKPIKNDPSAEQKQKLANLQRAEKSRRRQKKSHKSDIKKSRRKDWD